MAYLGNDLQVAYSTYKNIDDISGSFNGSTTSFALLVGGVAPVPLPLNSQQCLISVGGVIQRPDDTGSEGFRLSGGNIVFSSAPSTGEDFFGVILAGADYVNVGANFPDGSLGAPSITFDQDNDTGYYRSASGAISFSSNGVAAGTWNAAGVTAPSLVPTGSTVASNGIYLPSANTVAISTNSTERARIDSSGRLLVGTSTYAGNGKLIAAGNTGGNAGTLDICWTGSRPTAADTDIGYLRWYSADNSSSNAHYASIYASSDGASSSGSDIPGRLVFSTTADGASSPTERMRITSTGSVQSTNWAIFPSFINNRTAVFTADSGYGGAGQGGLVIYNTSGGVVLGVGATSWASYSDERMKTDLQPITQGLDKVSILRAVTGRYLTDEENVSRPFLIAQDVEQVLPEAVEAGNPDALSLRYTEVIPLLVAALKESKERIEALEQRLTDAGIA